MDDTGDLCFRVGDGTDMASACTSGVDFDDNTWHFVTGVKNGTTSIILYVDGRSRATATPTSTAICSTVRSAAASPPPAASSAPSSVAASSTSCLNIR